MDQSWGWPQYVYLLLVLLSGMLHLVKHGETNRINVKAWCWSAALGNFLLWYGGFW